MTWSPRTASVGRWRKVILKFIQSEFELEFSLGFGVVSDQLLAGRVGITHGFNASALALHLIRSFVLPKTLSRQEAVFQAGPRKLFQVLIFQMEGLGGALKFLRDVAAGNAGIVGGQGDRHAKLQIHRKRMMIAGD